MDGKVLQQPRDHEVRLFAGECGPCKRRPRGLGASLREVPRPKILLGRRLHDPVELLNVLHEPPLVFVPGEHRDELLPQSGADGPQEVVVRVREDVVPPQGPGQVREHLQHGPDVHPSEQRGQHLVPEQLQQVLCGLVEAAGALGPKVLALHVEPEVQDEGPHVDVGRPEVLQQQWEPSALDPLLQHPREHVDRQRTGREPPGPSYEAPPDGRFHGFETLDELGVPEGGQESFDAHGLTGLGIQDRDLPQALN
mmetsp:Transcript_136792/g.237589  ORF Transcript_136792/g.237589 Transcript_136792/m.237589 type:complete len:253 (-) Transcript_136792:4084-4842(-)